MHQYRLSLLCTRHSADSPVLIIPSLPRAPTSRSAGANQAVIADQLTPGALVPKHSQHFSLFSLVYFLKIKLNETSLTLHLPLDLDSKHTGKVATKSDKHPQWPCSSADNRTTSRRMSLRRMVALTPSLCSPALGFLASTALTTGTQ